MCVCVFVCKGGGQEEGIGIGRGGQVDQVSVLATSLCPARNYEFQCKALKEFIDADTNHVPL